MASIPRFAYGGDGVRRGHPLVDRLSWRIPYTNYAVCTTNALQAVLRSALIIFIVDHTAEIKLLDGIDLLTSVPQYLFTE